MLLSIQTKSLCKSYGQVYAVDNVDLTVKAGSIFGFLGPNGAGKSTMIKMLTTLTSPSSGGLQVLGVDAIKNPLEIRKKIGVVLQQPSYEPSLSVEQSLDKYGMMWNVPKNIRKQRIPQLLEDFDLVDIKRKKMEDLSIGQRRRIQAAREFMHDMELLFLDEPTVGLDPTARRNLLDYLKNKVKTGLTIFYTTHILSEAEYLCDEIAIINKGKIITVNTPTELKNKFGKEKTINIHLSTIEKNIPQLLSGIKDCKIDFDSGTNISILSHDSEKILLKILEILNHNNMSIENLSAVPTTLEDIFLEVVRDSNASNN
jgi:ABC-2 type transport system ATP-binding protein